MVVVGGCIAATRPMSVEAEHAVRGSTTNKQHSTGRIDRYDVVDGGRILLRLGSLVWYKTSDLRLSGNEFDPQSPRDVNKPEVSRPKPRPRPEICKAKDEATDPKPRPRM